MMRYILTILCILLTVRINGQFFSSSDQYEFNTLAINPAYAGCQDALSATLLYHNQWLGFKDAPKSANLALHAPLKNDRIGLGLLIGNYSCGIYNETNLIGNYAYRRELFNGKIALGLGFGVIIRKISWNDLDAVDAGDILLINNPESAILPNFSLGSYYYTDRYYIGISVPLFLSNELNENTGHYTVKNRFADYNYFVTGGYSFNLGQSYHLLSSLVLKFHAGNAVQIDYTMQFNVKDRIWLGMGYRNKNTVIGLLQCQLNHQLRIAYSYNYDLSPLGKYKSGSHEIVLNYVLRFARQVAGARQF
jgi:type IX secretion system PorP/SprF family membrane protein